MTDDDAIWAELRREFAARVRQSLAEVGRELAALAAGTRGDYSRIEALMHREAGAGAVFGFEDVSAQARVIEHLVQDLGDDTSTAALARIRRAVQPLQTIADGC
jgi:HPt (histidine-containing phosphotransfer) domain-containing protein